MLSRTTYVVVQVDITSSIHMNLICISGYGCDILIKELDLNIVDGFNFTILIACGSDASYSGPGAGSDFGSISGEPEYAFL